MRSRGVARRARSSGSGLARTSGWCDHGECAPSPLRSRSPRSRGSSSADLAMIVAVDGIAVHVTVELEMLLRTHPLGAALVLTVIKGADVQRVSVTLDPST